MVTSPVKNGLAANHQMARGMGQSWLLPAVIKSISSRLVLGVLACVWMIVYIVTIFAMKNKLNFSPFRSDSRHIITNTPIIVDYDIKDSNAQLNEFEGQAAMKHLNARLITLHGQEASKEWRDKKLNTVFAQGMARREEFAYFLDIFSPEINCPSMEKVGGLGESGKWICGYSTFLNQSECVVYAFGTNGDTDFVERFVMDTLCEVHVFDPYIPEFVKTRLGTLNDRLYYHDFTLGAVKGRKFEFDGLNGVDEFKTRTMEGIMQELKHKWVDVVQVDLLGEEFLFLSYLEDKRKDRKVSKRPCLSRLGQINVVVHTTQQNVERAAKFVGSLMEKDFRIFHVEPNFHSDPPWGEIGFSFIQLEPDGSFALRRKGQ